MKAAVNRLLLRIWRSPPFTWLLRGKAARREVITQRENIAKASKADGPSWFSLRGFIKNGFSAEPFKPDEKTFAFVSAKFELKGLVLHHAEHFTECGRCPTVNGPHIFRAFNNWEAVLAYLAEIGDPNDR